MKLPEVAIVILNYNGKKFLEQFLPSVLASTYANKRVIVADNASTDDSISFLKAFYPQVELLIHNQNYGFAGGYNKALQQVYSDYYVLLNSDVEVTPGWIEPIIAFMETQERIGVCQPKLLDYKRKEYFEYAGAAGGWLDSLGYPFARGRVFEVLEKAEAEYNDTVPVFWASGAAMFIKSAVYHEVNGMDEYFFAHQEEIDLCWRIQLAGYGVYCCPDAVVYHVGGGTLPKGHRKTYLNFRNNLVMLLKNLPFAEQCWKIPLRVLMDFLFAAKCISGGDLKSAVAIAQAHWGVLRWSLGIDNGEAPSGNRKPMKKLSGVWQHSIVWAYFIKRQTRFAEIVKH